jgi:hypothetical protein
MADSVPLAALGAACQEFRWTNGRWPGDLEEIRAQACSGHGSCALDRYSEVVIEPLTGGSCRIKGLYTARDGTRTRLKMTVPARPQ